MDMFCEENLIRLLQEKKDTWFRIVNLREHFLKPLDRKHVQDTLKILIAKGLVTLRTYSGSKEYGYKREINRADDIALSSVLTFVTRQKGNVACGTVAREFKVSAADAEDLLRVLTENGYLVKREYTVGNKYRALRALAQANEERRIKAQISRKEGAPRHGSGTVATPRAFVPRAYKFQMIASSVMARLDLSRGHLSAPENLDAMRKEVTRERE